ncbi:hypothetical protein [Aliiroseovarius sp.]|uniref:hypothetical protein n=1 Tax=Aliiroseovarius sp. TaxID=1872442 RepID=UPI003BA97036
MTIIEDLKGVWAFASEEPVLFFGLMAVFLPLIWWKWRVIGGAERRAMAQTRAGWTEDATPGQMPHETGIGQVDVLVMRPSQSLVTVLAILAFFGSGAAFYALVVLPSAEVTPKDWAVFTIMCGLSLIGLLILYMSFTRLSVGATEITRSGLLRRGRAFPFSALRGTEPLGKTIAGGVKLDFGEHGQLKVPAQYAGYRQLLARLAKNDPKLRMMMRLLDPRRG